jgi:acyl-CoA synthetase (AMP-forming)/AMP-acid ligase II
MFCIGRETLVNCLLERSQSQPDDVAFTYLVDGENQVVELSYGELDRRARAIARSLQRRIPPNERVLLAFPNGLDFIAGLFGCFYAGLVAVCGVSPTTRNHERFLKILRESATRVVIGPEAVLDRFRGSLSIDNSHNFITWLTTAVIELEPADGTSWRAPNVSSDSSAVTQYTSGSTEDPRGVILTHRNLMHNLEAQRRTLAYDSRDVIVSWLPFWHDMGLIGGLLMPIYV